MSNINKILNSWVRVVFTALGSYFGGPVGAFIGSMIGSVVGNLLFPITDKSRRANEIAKVNVRLAEPLRYICAGRVKQGGAVLFGEHDTAGNLWYLIVHCDSQLTELNQYYLDDKPVAVDVNGVVLNKEFRLKDNKNRDVIETDGEGIGYVQLWTTTHSADNPTPPAIAALTAAFPSKWTSDHKLVGTTYTVVKMSALKAEHRQKIYKWRGALGLGEPAVAIVGNWSKCYDPRDVAQLVNDATTHEFTRNPVLQWAWFRTHPYGRGKPVTSINWDMVATQATICDQTVTGITGDHVRYECGFQASEDRARNDVEQDILRTCDGQLMFDDDGKSWVRVGHYTAPTLTLTRNRDIVAMESLEALDGESETQGVIIRFTDPDAGYTVQPSAPWYNPLYYVEGQPANFATIDAVEIQDHNQAMRIAKAIGLRLQPSHKLAPTTGLRGLKAARERFVNLNYDNTFAGDHEIVSQVEIDASGKLCKMGLVPVDANRWTLTAGEERPKPVIDDALENVTYDTIDAGDVTLTIDAGQILIVVADVYRDDAYFMAEYVRTADMGTVPIPWLAFTMTENTGYSGTVIEGESYTVRVRYVTASGYAAPWLELSTTPSYSISQAGFVTVAGDVGEAVVSWRNPTESTFAYSDVWRHTANDFGAATKIVADLTGGLGQVQTITDTIAAGTYYYWVVPHALDGTPATVGAPVSGVVT